MVDLIPAEYRRSLRLRRMLRAFAWSCLALLLAFGVSFAALGRALGAERAALARYRQLQAQSAAWHARLAELKSQQEDIDRRLGALSALRGGNHLGPLFDAVDSALNARIWFRDLEYTQAADAGTPGQAPAATTSARTATPAASAPARNGARSPHIEIRGIAADHAALADFVEQLGTRPGIAHVELRDSSTRDYPNMQLIDFHLAAQMRTP
jgi:hypothetical protein